MLFKSVCALAALSCAALPALAQDVGEAFEAVFDHQGVSGTVSFQRFINSGIETTKMRVKLSGLDGRASGWHVHELPVEYRSCGSTGGHYNPEDLPNLGELTDKHGSFEGLTTTDKTYLDGSLMLTGPNSIVGRSIVLHRNETNARFVCATIRPALARISPQEERIAVATFTGEFNTDIKGTILFRQFRDSELTQVLVDLRGADTDLHKWHVHVNPADKTKDVEGVCTSTGGHHDPLGVEVDGYSCNVTDSMASCYIGDLVGKHGALNLSSTTSSRMMFSDMVMPLFGIHGILGRSVTVHAEGLGGPRVSCATIQDLQPIQMVASEFGAGVEGTVSFSQRTAAFDPTFVRINMPEVPEEMGAWHVHVNPVPRTDNTCGANSTAGHWIPFPDEVVKPSSDAVTMDQYETGDLTGRWGTLNALANDKKKIGTIFVDDHMPLVGKYGIGGRSIVIHKNDETKARLTCATIRHLEPERTVVAVFGKLTVDFKPDAAAPADDQLSGTFEVEPAPWGEGVIIRNTLVTNSVGGSNDHAFHVHVNAVADSADANSFDCSTTGGHFDPDGFEVDGYTCDPLKPTECYAGDLGGKAGKLDIKNQDVVMMSPHVIYDPNLDFEDLVERGIVIHGANSTAPRIACGTLKRTAADSELSGVVRFAQSRRGSGGSAGSVVHTRLSLVDGGASEEHNWHIHSNVVGDDGASGLCSSTGGHYDPFLANPKPLPEGMQPYPAPETATSDRYELGDLTGKFGRLAFSDAMSRGTVQHDQMLPLEGAYSILDRSVTVHAEALGGPRIACGTLKEECPVPYTFCTKVSQCTENFGGVDANWRCYAMTTVKKANCILLEGDCRFPVCANNAVQQVIETDEPVGHCVHNIMSTSQYSFSSHVAIADVTTLIDVDGGGGGGGDGDKDKKGSSSNDLPLILSLVGVSAAGAVAMVMVRRNRKDKLDRDLTYNPAPRSITPVATPAARTKTTSFKSAMQDEEEDTVSSLASGSTSGGDETSYLSTVQSAESMNSGTSWSTLSDGSSMQSTSHSQSMNSEMMPSLMAEEQIPGFLSNLL